MTAGICRELFVPHRCCVAGGNVRYVGLTRAYLGRWWDPGGRPDGGGGIWSGGVERACHTCASVAERKGWGGDKVNKYKSRKSEDNRDLSYFIFYLFFIVVHAK